MFEFIELDNGPYNFLTAKIIFDLTEKIKRTEARCIILTSNNESFSWGFDPEYMLALGKSQKSIALRSVAEFVKASGHSRVPLIADIKGPAFAGGAVIALACDVMIGTDPRNVWHSKTPYQPLELTEPKVGLPLPEFVFDLVDYKNSASSRYIENIILPFRHDKLTTECQNDIEKTLSRLDPIVVSQTLWNAKRKLRQAVFQPTQLEAATLDTSFNKGLKKVIKKLRLGDE